VKRKFKQWWSSIQQYQQNERSPLILTALTEHKKDPDITFEIQVQA